MMPDEGGKIGQLARVQVLNLTSDVPKLFNESDDFLKDALFLRQILRIYWTHLRQNSIEVSAVLAGVLPF